MTTKEAIEIVKAMKSTTVERRVTTARKFGPHTVEAYLPNPTSDQVRFRIDGNLRTWKDAAFTVAIHSN